MAFAAGDASRFVGIGICSDSSATCLSSFISYQVFNGNWKSTRCNFPANSGDQNKGGLGGKLNKVVLAYSGSLDASVIVPWLKENYGCEVVCFTADVVQGAIELEGLDKKAKASGACQLVVKDLKEEFVSEYIYPYLRAGAVYERKYLLGTSMARPVIAKMEFWISVLLTSLGYLRGVLYTATTTTMSTSPDQWTDARGALPMVDVAKEVGADAVAHGCTGKGNDQVRFELTFYALNPELKVVAPWREWDITGRKSYAFGRLDRCLKESLLEEHVGEPISLEERSSERISERNCLSGEVSGDWHHRRRSCFHQRTIPLPRIPPRRAQRNRWEAWQLGDPEAVQGLGERRVPEEPVQPVQGGHLVV
ncbi:unnamed protein product [Miscanthus lutarioriparius]|uniref:argininosuccinate synthase n=1 Tax=Miscanthus lutarioriparius TaxID=422564 RepID=A0A811RN85_9POAL|nr:unnamed protein product [Miscanthus lutarioriparius]